MSPALLLTGLVLASVEVSGSSKCPTAQEVGERLGALLAPELQARAEGHHAIISREVNTVRIELLDGSGASLATRTLGGTARCSELASAAAVIISAWEAELRYAPAAPALVPAAPPIEEPRPAPAPAPPQPLRGEPPVPPEVGVAFTASLSSGGVALGGRVSLAVIGREGWGGALGLAGFGERSLTEGESTLEWQRYAITLGPIYRVAAAGLRFDFHADVLPGMLEINGQNLVSRRRLIFDPGLSAGVRLLTGLGLWFGASTAGWIFYRDVVINPETAYFFPPVEFLLAVGFTAGGA